MKKTSDSTTVVVHQLYMPTGTSNQLPLNPISMGDRATGLSDSYANFRLKSLRFRTQPTGVYGAVGYLTGSANSTPPTSVLNIMEIVPACVVMSDHTVPGNWVTVPKADLAGPMPWYKTQTTSGNDEFPGYLVNAGTALAIEYFATIEFKGSVDPANTPEFVEFRRKYREEVERRHAFGERDRLLSLLAVKGSETTKSTGGGMPPVPK